MSSLLEEEHLAPSPPPAPLPTTEDTELVIPTFTLAQDVCGVTTELIVQTFDDRIFVVVSQMNGKPGCLTQASLPSSIPTQPPHRPSSPPTSKTLQSLSLLPPPSSSIHLSPLLGAPPDQTIHDLYVSQIASIIWFILESSRRGMAGQGRRGVVVGLALKMVKVKEGDEEEEEEERERERFAGIMEMVAEWPGA